MLQKQTLGVSLLCFNNERVLKNSLQNLQKLDFSAFSNVQIFVFDCGYPKRDILDFARISAEFNAKLVSMKNHGQTANIRKTVPYLKDFDYVLGWEPDADLTDKNFLTVSLEIFSDLENVGYTVPKHQDWVYDRQGDTRFLTSHKECKIIRFQGGFPLLFYKGEAFKKLENLQQSCKGPYGGAEYDIWKAIQPLQGVMLRNISDKVDQSQYDPEYMHWKATTIGRTDQKFFEESL